MEDVIIVVILVALAVGIGWYLYRAKKKGKKCIGCPYANQCGDKCGNGCNSAPQSNESNGK